MRLLFKPKFNIQTLMMRLNDEGNKVIGLNTITDIQLRVFDDGLAKLRAAMHPYLDFSKL